MRRINALLLMLMVYAGCEESPQEPETPQVDVQYMEREWAIARIPNGALVTDTLDMDRQDEGVLAETLVLGGMVLYPPNEGPEAKADVFSNESGQTYWVSVQAPITDLDSGSAIGGTSELSQYQLFRKTSEGASLRYVISEVLLEALDANANAPSVYECPWQTGTLPVEQECVDLMSGSVDLEIEVLEYNYDPEEYESDEVFIDSVETLYRIGGIAEFYGYRGNFRIRALSNLYASDPLWDRGDFDSIPDPGNAAGGGKVILRSDIVIEIPLDSVPVGGVFDVTTEVIAVAYTRRQRESYMSAYFRDPAQSAGLSVTQNGLLSLRPRNRPKLPPMAPCTAGSTPVTGTLQFDAVEYFSPEQPRGHARVLLTRANGSDGVAAAHITTSDGNATAGSDYDAVDDYVVFADGEQGSRVLDIAILADTIVEDDETIQLMLTEIPGCGSLGSPPTATLTILDDDDPPVPPSYTVGGIVTGLSGTGLVLTNLSTDDLTIDANGPFEFGREHGNGAGYEVRVATQPSNPTQVCTVTHGSGFIAGADVTDVEVNCVTPPPDGSGLDGGFGSDGKVTAGAIPGASAMALQSDGKILVVGGNILARYGTDGSPDPSFGSGGEVFVDFYGASYDELHAVAVQDDGRILVAGHSKDGVNSPVQEDFIVARYEADGVPDAGFGIDGKVITDFYGRGDAAYGVLIRPDGKIVVAGQVSVVDAFGLVDADFGAVRYTSAGVVDSTFGVDGKVTADVAGRTDLAYAAAMQPDAAFVIAGRVANSGGADPDVGLVRFLADGVPDPDFGTDGVVRIVTADVWDEAAAVIVQPDGKIVATGRTRPLGQSFGMMVMRFMQDGTLDSDFGDAGVSIDGTDLGAIGNGLALQPDGKIVVAGWGSEGTSAEFVVQRFNADGTVDPNLLMDGRLVLDFFGAADVAKTVAIQSDGKIVVAGSAVNGTQTGLGMIRVVPLEGQR